MVHLCDATNDAVSNERFPTAIARPTPRPNDIGLNKIMNKLSVGHNKNIIVRRTFMIHDSLSYYCQWTARR